MASPFLKIGITLAIFSSSGKIPDRKDSFIKVARSVEMGRSRIFNSLTGILKVANGGGGGSKLQIFTLAHTDPALLTVAFVVNHLGLQLTTQPKISGAHNCGLINLF